MEYAINEKQLRAGIKNCSTKPLPYCNIAHKPRIIQNPFLPDESSDIIVYGRGKSRTVAVRTWYGRKLSFKTLGKVSADADGYVDAARLIENWLAQGKYQLDGTYP